MSRTRGLFIVFEGIDRCGKTTQVSLLVDYLQSLSPSTSSPCGVKRERFPDRSTSIGGVIDGYLTSKHELDDRVIHLLFSANRWEKHRELIETLDAGAHVVCDRYAYSGVAFSAAKGLPLNWCKSCDAGLPSPDVVFYLDMDPASASLRSDYGGERYEKHEMQLRVQEQFRALFDPSWKIIDASQSIEKVSANICAEVDRLLGERAVYDVESVSSEEFKSNASSKYPVLWPELLESPS